MFKDHATLMHELRDYASPKAKITRLIKSGEIIQLRRGIFLPAGERGYSRKSLAAIIYGPSYVSFETALSHYGLIPERVNAITSATFKKNKNRIFHTPLGDFYYYYLPTAAYPYAVKCEQEGGANFLIASPEKALCDLLFRAGRVGSCEALRGLLHDDWRIDPGDLERLDIAAVEFLAPLYRKTVFRHLLTLLKKGT